MLTRLACFRSRSTAYFAVLVVGFPISVVAGASGADVESSGDDRFAPVRQVLLDAVEGNSVGGAVGYVIQNSVPVYLDAVGYRDIEAEQPMTVDTLFRIKSMTKPITAVAVMMLVEEGRIGLDEPLSKYVPSFAEPRVVSTDGGRGEETVTAGRELTIHHLLTHTSGLTYASFEQEPLATLYTQAGLGEDLEARPTALVEPIQRLGTIPLLHHPGEAWQYGLSMDVLGRVVEVASGVAFDEFLRERVFQPLGMTDTYFFVPADELDRLATLYRDEEDGRLSPVPIDAQAPDASRTFFSGGAGLVSTARDYGRFLQMLLNQGELDGSRILKAETVALMTRNQIGELDNPFDIHGDKYGYGIAVHSENAPDGPSAGSFSWGGSYNTYFWVDRERRLIGVVLAQTTPFNHFPLWTAYQSAVYRAID